MSRGVCLLLLASLSAYAQDVAAQLRSLASADPVISRAHFGYKVVDLTSGQLLAADRNNEFFTPASNLKLYTSALALQTLGRDYVFNTELRTSAPPLTRGQATLPDLILVGGGDPNLSGRPFPYQVNAPDGDPLAAFHELANKLLAEGVHEIAGDVVGDATRYPSELYPDGWAVEDTLYDYGAPVSSLSFNDNTVHLLLHPGEPGDLADIQVRPAVPYLVILNETVTGPIGKMELHVSRPGNRNELVVWGTVAADAVEVPVDVAVDDPALFAAEAMIEALEEVGIRVDGQARSRYCPSSVVPDASQPCHQMESTVLATHTSLPLTEVTTAMNKNSMNLHAEMLLREVASHEPRSSAPSLDPPRMEELDGSFLQSIGITHDGSGLAVVDGSGLSQQDLLTPDSTIQLLQYMWTSPNREVWLNSLPVGGVDGTLEERFKGIAEADHVHAKTGTLSHVNALSGYVQSRSGHWLAFSVMVNGTVSENQQVRAFIDQFCQVLLGQ